MERHKKGEKKECQSEVPCPKCDGCGRIARKKAKPSQDDDAHYQCPRCNGSGIILDVYLIEFDGEKWVRASRLISPDGQLTRSKAASSDGGTSQGWLPRLFVKQAKDG